jgi:hypothetical protein
MAQAKYTIKIPATDRWGAPLKDLSPVAHSWLTRLNREIQHSHSEGPHPDRDGTTYRHLVVLGTDMPEVDSHIKQLGAHIGELTNHPHTFVMKEGKGGPQSWTVMNPKHDPTAGAHPDALAPLPFLY